MKSLTFFDFSSLRRDISRLADLVVLPHSVFALPFAVAALLLAGRGVPRLEELLLIVVAVVSARTAAMGFNRIVDRGIDAENPRTAARELPSGAVTVAAARRLVVLSALVFLGAAALLGMHCLVLAPLVLGVLLGYSYTKRFTELSHLVLGLALGLAPGGAWWAVRPEVTATPLVLMLGVITWVGGFDIIYSCQDVEFDRGRGLFSIPSRFGVRRALLVSRALHVVAGGCFALVGALESLGPFYFAGLVPIGMLLAYQHSIVSESDLSRVNRAFFTTNGFVSIGYLVLVLACVR